MFTQKYFEYRKESFIDIIPTYNFIVLKNDKKRYEHIIKLISKNNIRDYNIVEATDGKKIDVNFYYEKGYIQKEAIHNLRQGAIGCALSNIFLWEKFLKTNNNMLLIMEDDIYFTKDFEIKLKNYIQHLPNNFDITQLWAHPAQYKTRFLKSPNINKYVKKGFGQYGTVAYIISKKGAIKLLKYCKPIYEPIDEMIKKQIEYGNVISYVPTQEIIQMPYAFESNIWNTKKI